MKLFLPHREVNLDTSLSFTDRVQFINELLAENSGLLNNKCEMTVEEYFRFTWDKQPTRAALDIIGYYLTKNNFTEGEDREVLSNKKVKEMDKGSKRYVNISSMSIQTQLEKGFVDLEDNYNNIT